MLTLINRLKEPSTWVGLGSFLVALGVVTPDVFDAAVLTITQWVGIVSLVAGMVIKEPGTGE